jgi:hypothetical protein
MAASCDVCEERPPSIDGCCAQCWLTLAKLGSGAVTTQEAIKLRDQRGVRFGVKREVLDAMQQ